MLGFKKVVNKNYILISPDNSFLLPKSIFFVFFNKKLKKYNLAFLQEPDLPLCGIPCYTLKKMQLFIIAASK